MDCETQFSTALQCTSAVTTQKARFGTTSMLHITNCLLVLANMVCFLAPCHGCAGMAKAKHSKRNIKARQPK
jgi:hypothetical protein